MLSGFQAEGNILGFQVDLSWTWTGPGARPALVLVRSRRAHPHSASGLRRHEDLEHNGLQVVDLEQTLGDPADGWALIQRELYLGRNTGVESNLQLAEFSQYFRTAQQPTNPKTQKTGQIVIGYVQPPTNSYTSLTFTDITDISYEESDSEDWSSIQCWEISHNTGSGPAAVAGKVTVSRSNRDGISPDQFAWQLTGQNEVVVNFDQLGQQHTEINLEEGVNPDSGDWTRQVRVIDRALVPEQIYYYRLYVKHNDVTQGTVFYSSQHHWTTEAMASADYDFSNQLYRQLPAVHQVYDEPDAGDKGQGQLRRYLSLAGATLDHSRSLAELLRHRHDSHRVYSKALPGLAKMIGWQPDVTSDAQLLRKDILDAPAIYRSVGTLANLRSMVNRVTDWDCTIKEFVHNIFLTNAVEQIHLWEIWGQHQHRVDVWTTPKALTQTDGFDGHPLAVTHATKSWLFWHSDRGGRRSLWRQSLNAESPVAKPLVLRDSQQRINTNELIDETPTVVADDDRLWLFWASNDQGQWNIWGSWSQSEVPFSTGPDSAQTMQSQPRNLSDHRADDRCPAAIRETEDRLWLFWQSSRRGPTDIWCRVNDGGDWGLPARITTADHHHLAPAVTIDDDGRIWLFFANDQGDRINIHVTLYISDKWTEAYQITSGKHRDESPSAVIWNHQIHLFWHSNRNKRWQVFGQAMSWSDGGLSLAKEGPDVITDEVTADKEPFAWVDSATDQLHISWRSQRRGRQYQSCSIDTGDAKMLAELGSFKDRAHYSYDTGRNDNDYYARDVVGVFLTPNPDKPDLDDRNRRLLSGPLKEFIPINIRPLLFIEPEVYSEHVYTYDAPEGEPPRFIEEEYSRVSTRVTDEVYTGLNDSYSDTIAAWSYIFSWSSTYSDHHTLDTTTTSPNEFHFRTWHIGVNEGT